MRKKLFLLILGLFLAASAVFSQYGGYYADGSSGRIGIEASAGFQLNRTRINNTNYISSPALALTARQYMGFVTYNVELGYAVVLAASFLSEMAWTVPRGVSFYMDNRTFSQGQTATIKFGDADYLINTSLVAGPSIRGSIAGGLGFVCDLGLAANIDLANWQRTHVNSLLMQLLTGTTMVTTYLELRTVNIGMGMNAGLQYRLGAASGRPMIIEMGLNMSYYFGRFNVYETGGYPDGNRSKKVVLHEASGAYEKVRILRFGAPYIVIGLTL